MASPRSLTVDPANSGVYHCISRCVRRAFLCGRDSHSGQNFEQEVAYRWLQLFPGTRSKPVEEPPDEAEIKSFCKDRGRLADARARLGSLSWFMRSLNEPIARRANEEDGCTGHFWEGRFKSQKLADEGAALACMVYVDLNPVRAGIADTLEGSDFTSAQDRIAANLARRQLAQTPPNPTPPQLALIESANIESCRDQWLTPIGPRPEEGSPSALDSSSQVSPAPPGPPAS